MSKFLEIQSAILSLGPGEYQRLCSEYSIKKFKFNNMHDLGSKEGTNKTTKGIPDSYSIDENQKYTLLMYGTVKKDSIAKLTKDIKEACDEKKTGIMKEQIKEIICFHTNTNIKPGEYNKLINLVPDIKITLIDIDSMAHDIYENYQVIAYDFLNIPIDTNQISDIKTFIERYDKFSINSPLELDFIYRKDKDLIYKNIMDSKMTIISGKPGNGKTKISLEILKQLEKKDNYTPLCIRINGLNLYDDIKKSIQSNKKYIIFIDDINNLNVLNSIIDLIITNKNEEIKIVATVRDYLLADVLNKLNACIEPNIYLLNKMEDSELIDILEKNYDVKNKNWQEKILKIANGNPRLAIMSFVAVRDGKIESLNSVYDIFKNYYDSILKEKNISSHEMDILFYTSLLSPISTSNEIVKKILSDLQIFDVNEFKKLRDMELIDYFNEDALKICDQNFANYILCKYLIVDKTITISDLLKKLYHNFINKFINAINMINEQFYNEETLNYITTEINKVWNEEAYNNDWKFLEYFHNVNPSKALLKIKNKIDSYTKEEIPEEIKYNSNVYLNDGLLNLISDFKNTEYLKMSFELLLSYLEKKPGLYNEICKSLKDYWLVKELYSSFTLEVEIIGILYSKYKKEENSKMKYIYHILLEQSLLYCLELEFHISEQGKNERTINLITLKLQESENVFLFRKKLFDIIFQLCDENKCNYKILLNESIWSYDNDQIEILKKDVQYLDENYFINWKNISITQSKILYLLKLKCKKLKVDIPISLKKYKECPEFLIINLFEKYDYGKSNKELIKFLENKNKEFYTKIFQTLNKVEKQNIKVDNWKIQSSLDILFKYLIAKDASLFKDIFKSYLYEDCPFVNGLFFIRDILDKDLLDAIIDNIIKSNTTKKYYLLTCILNNYHNKKYIFIVKDFIKNQNTTNKYTLSIESVIKYSKYNKELLENYTKEILEQDEFDLYSCYTISCADEEFAKIVYNAFANKELLEELYLKSVGCYGDYEGNLGYLLCVNNYDLLNKIIEKDRYNHTDKIKNIIKKIWTHHKHNEIISYNYNKMIDSNLGYLRLHSLFESAKEENIKSWFKNKILESRNDKEEIYYLFYVIGEKDNSLKEELILFLLDNTNNIEIFKNVSLFSHSESWSGSRIPIIEQKIEFIQSLLTKIKEKDKLLYIEHINYLNERIDSYKQKIKRTQIKEYVDDFINK